MLKENKKTLILTSIITLLPILAGVLFWNRLPDSMATHFGFNNEANGFSNKAFAVFGMPLIMLALLWTCAFITSRDPRGHNINAKLVTLALWTIPVISLIVAAIMYPYNLGYRFDITFCMELFMGLMFVIIGNYLPKARQNYTFGIRIPWTLNNEENWNRTHRFAGFLWVAGGIIIILAALTGFLNLAGLIAVLAVLIILPCCYSLWLHSARHL